MGSSSSPARDARSGLKAIHRLYSRLTADIDRRLASRSATATDRRILIELRRAPRSTDVGLARALGLDRSHLSRAMAKLIREGLVCHSPHPSHGSQRLLSLSPDGEKRAAALEEEWTQALEQQMQELPDHEMRLVFASAGARVSDLREAARYEVEIKPLDGAGIAWLMNHVGSLGRREMTAVANHVARFLNRGLDDVGYQAVYFHQVIGTCFLVMHGEDDLIMRVEGFYVDPAAENTPTAGRLLQACVDGARAVTVSRVVAKLPEWDKSTGNLFRSLGFKRDKTKQESFRFGPKEILRRYELNLPLYKPPVELEDD